MIHLTFLRLFFTLVLTTTRNTGFWRSMGIKCRSDLFYVYHRIYKIINKLFYFSNVLLFNDCCQEKILLLFSPQGIYTVNSRSPWDYVHFMLYIHYDFQISKCYFAGVEAVGTKTFFTWNKCFMGFMWESHSGTFRWAI